MWIGLLFVTAALALDAAGIAGWIHFPSDGAYVVINVFGLVHGSALLLFSSIMPKKLK